MKALVLTLPRVSECVLLLPWSCARRCEMRCLKQRQRFHSVLMALKMCLLMIPLSLALGDISEKLAAGIFKIGSLGELAGKL